MNNFQLYTGYCVCYFRRKFPGPGFMLYCFLSCRCYSVILVCLLWRGESQVHMGKVLTRLCWFYSGISLAGVSSLIWCILSEDWNLRFTGIKGLPGHSTSCGRIFLAVTSGLPIPLSRKWNSQVCEDKGAMQAWMLFVVESLLMVLPSHANSSQWDCESLRWRRRALPLAVYHKQKSWSITLANGISSPGFLRSTHIHLGGRISILALPL